MKPKRKHAKSTTLTVHRPVGRPTVMTEDVLRKLETAYLLGCTDIEACFSAGIGRRTLSDYEEAHPEFSQRKKELRKNPIYQARNAVLNAILKGDAKTAIWLLTHKCKKEFGTQRQEVTVQTNIEPISVNDWAQAQNNAFLGIAPPEPEQGQEESGGNTSPAGAQPEGGAE